VYESPFRVQRTLHDVLDVMGNRRAALARELTKKFEEILRGRVTELLAALEGRSLKGECVLVIAGAGDRAEEAGGEET
jgi:16S rRNA (cytidine1402-2'-O)-methyltransferase